MTTCNTGGLAQRFILIRRFSLHFPLLTINLAPTHLKKNENRYAIGNAERPMMKNKIGWLDALADATQEYYYANNTGGGPSIKVGIYGPKRLPPLTPPSG